MTLYLNTSNTNCYTQKKSSGNYNTTNRSGQTNFKGNNQNRFEDFKNNKINKTNIALSGILVAGLSLGIDFIFNHGKTSKRIWNKLNPTKQISENYVENIEQIQQNFSKIFGKNFSKKEANEMALKYKSIMEESDINILSEKLFNEIKKDYGLHGVELKKAGSIHLGNNVKGGAMTDQTSTVVTIYLDSIKNDNILSPKVSLFEKLCHELCHVRQNRILYRDDKEKLIDILANRAPNELTKDCWNEILLRNGNDRKQAIIAIKNQLRDLFKHKYGNVENLPQKSATDIEQLFYNKQHYKRAGSVPHEEYISQPIEKEAYEISDLAQKLLGFMNIK